MQKEKVFISDVESEDQGTFNTFSVDSVEIEQIPSDIIIRHKALIKAKVDFHCKAHGHLMCSLITQAEATDMDDIEALRKCVESLLNHRYYPRMSVHSPKCECSPSFDKVEYYFGNLQEPFKSLFENLFKDKSWCYPKDLMNRK